MPYTEYDIVMNSIQKHPLEVAKAVNQLMADRIADEITARRIAVANALFKGEPTDDIETEDMELDAEDENEVEVSDEDLEEFSVDENDDSEIEEPNEEEDDQTA